MTTPNVILTTARALTLEEATWLQHARTNTRANGLARSAQPVRQHARTNLYWFAEDLEIAEALHEIEKEAMRNVGIAARHAYLNNVSMQDVANRTYGEERYRQSPNQPPWLEAGKAMCEAAMATTLRNFITSTSEWDEKENWLEVLMAPYNSVFNKTARR
jgi:hypothetical protein